MVIALLPFRDSRHAEFHFFFYPLGVVIQTHDRKYDKEKVLCHVCLWSSIEWTRYGMLPPETRYQQAALFNSPNNKSNVLIATDAIGMGMLLSLLSKNRSQSQHSSNHLFFPLQIHTQVLEGASLHPTIQADCRTSRKKKLRVADRHDSCLFFISSRTSHNASVGRLSTVTKVYEGVPSGAEDCCAVPSISADLQLCRARIAC